MNHKEFKAPSVEDYEPLIGAEAVQRILDKAAPLKSKHITHVNSTYYGGGVAQLLSTITLLMNGLGVKTGWRVLQGSPDFFSVTKKMHNALQGCDINLTDRKKKLYESVTYENAMRNHLDHDFVFIHDPQPLALIDRYEKKGPWIWRCHVDLSHPHEPLWDYMSKFVKKYDAVILSLEEFRQDMKPPQVFIMPAIDPFSILNKDMSEEDVNERLDHYGIPTDLPIVTQVSRFDRWKDPEGVIQAFKIARRQTDATLVLLGNVAADDPEGPDVYESLLDEREDRIIILSEQDTALVNALQRRAAVALQKSRREGFGLTVAEAMWKRTPVIGGNVGGIRHQIQDGENGYLVSSVQEAADRMVELLKDEAKRERMGASARNGVKQKFLMTRQLEEHLDILNAFHAHYELKM